MFLRILPGTHHSLAGGRWRPLSRSLQTRATARWVSLQPRDFYTLARPHPESLTKRNETGSPCWGTLRRPWSVLKALGQSGSGSWAYLCSSTSQAAGEVRFIQDVKRRRKGTRSERLASRCPEDGARSVLYTGPQSILRQAVALHHTAVRAVWKKESPGSTCNTLLTPPP